MPRLLCLCERGQSPFDVLPSCVKLGTTTQLPFVCPMENFLNVEELEGLWATAEQGFVQTWGSTEKGRPGARDTPSNPNPQPLTPNPNPNPNPNPIPNLNPYPKPKPKPNLNPNRGPNPSQARRSPYVILRPWTLLNATFHPEAAEALVRALSLCPKP